MDKLTSKVAAEWIAQYDAAAKNENLAEMERIVGIVCASPNIPFKNEILNQLGA